MPVAYLGMDETTRSKSPARRFRRLERRSLHGFDVMVARDPLSRLVGLAFLDRDRAPEGLLIPRCRSVHTYGMRFPLDLLFLGQTGRPLIAVREVGPGHRVRVPGAAAVLELPSDWDFDKWDPDLEPTGFAV